MATKKKTTKKVGKSKSTRLTGAPATEKQRLDAIRAIEAKAMGSPTSGRGRKPKAGAKKAKVGDTANRRGPRANSRKPGILTLAAEILAASKEPMSARSIVEEAIASKRWTTTGKTPHATLYAAMIREIATRGKDSRFTKVERGRFTASGKGR